MTQGPNPPKAGFYDHEFEKLIEISSKLTSPTPISLSLKISKAQPPPNLFMIILTQFSLPSDHTGHTEASTQGASKMRRDSINGEVMKLRDLLPLPASTR